MGAYRGTKESSDSQKAFGYRHEIDRPHIAGTGGGVMLVAPNAVNGRQIADLAGIAFSQRIRVQAATEHLRACVDAAKGEVLVKDIFALAIEPASGAVALYTGLDSSKTRRVPQRRCSASHPVINHTNRRKEVSAYSAKPRDLGKNYR